MHAFSSFPSRQPDPKLTTVPQNDAGEAHYIGNLWAEGIPYEVARVDM